MWDYSEKVKAHFFEPKNAKAVEDANARGDVGSLSCGDALSLTLKVNPESEIIEKAGFQTFGCGSAIASSSALTELIIGKTLNEALSITNQDIADYLDGLPPEKMHCSVMGMEALHAAVANYRGEEIDDDHEEGELICKCFAIDDAMIKRVVKTNQLTTLDEVINYTKAGGACASCHEKIEWVLEECLKQSPVESAGKEEPVAVELATSSPEPAPKKTSLVQKIKIIEQVLDEVRPGIQADGGDIQLADLDGDLVFVSMTGNCTGCGMAGMTIANIEARISQALGFSVTVFPVQQSAANKEGTHHG